MSFKHWKCLLAVLHCPTSQLCLALRKKKVDASSTDLIKIALTSESAGGGQVSKGELPKTLVLLRA